MHHARSTRAEGDVALQAVRSADEGYDDIYPDLHIVQDVASLAEPPTSPPRRTGGGSSPPSSAWSGSSTHQNAHQNALTHTDTAHTDTAHRHGTLQTPHDHRHRAHGG